MAPAMPCKTCKKSKNGETRSKTNDFKFKFACILEASESTRMRMEESLPNYHEDHIAGRGDHSLQHYNLVHKFIPMPQVMKNTSSKGRSGQGMGKTGDKPSIATGENQEQGGGYSRSTKRQKESAFRVIDGHLWSQEFGVGTKISNIYRTSRAQRETLWKTTQVHLQYSRSKVHQHHKWQPQRSWT